MSIEFFRNRSLILVSDTINSTSKNNIQSLIRTWWWEKTLESKNVWHTFIMNLRVGSVSTIVDFESDLADRIWLMLVVDGSLLGDTIIDCYFT